MSLLGFHCVGSILTVILIGGLAQWLREEDPYWDWETRYQDLTRFEFALNFALTALLVHLIEITIYIGMGEFDG